MIETKDATLINKVIDSFTHDNNSLLDQLNSIVYYFRGGYNRDDVFAMSPVEREKAVEFAQKRLEDAAKIQSKGGTIFV